MSKIKDKTKEEIGEVFRQNLAGLTLTDSPNVYKMSWEEAINRAERVLSIPEIKKGLLLYEAAEKGNVAIVDRKAKLITSHTLEDNCYKYCSYYEDECGEDFPNECPLLKAGWVKEIR